ncbi:hemerythrin domain-containing protein [Roseibium sp.]|uniref:hemerythrin domain-containing protein n=1 Tax=Roseibium sp. TaxID=1936156 RepID=UPI003A97154F
MNSSTEAKRLALDALAVPPPVNLFAAPIEYLFAEHFRHRTLCNLLDELAVEGQSDQEDVTVVVAFLETDFALHVRDEEEDFYPLLRKRMKPEDGIADLLAQLSEDHLSEQSAATEIVDVLRQLPVVAGHIACSRKASDLIERFTKHERRHLTCENAIVLPLARARLSARDMLDLGHSMARRRGIDFPETENAL